MSPLLNKGNIRWDRKERNENNWVEEGTLTSSIFVLNFNGTDAFAN